MPRASKLDTAPDDAFARKQFCLGKVAMRREDTGGEVRAERAAPLEVSGG